MLGKIIQENRKRIGLSQGSLAEKINVSRQSVSKWEQDLAYPTIDNCVELCKVFEISMDQLVGIKTESKTIDKNSIYKWTTVGLIILLIGVSLFYVLYPNVKIERYPQYVNLYNDASASFRVEKFDVDIYKDESEDIFVKVTFDSKEYSEEMVYDVIINKSIVQNAKHVSGKKYEAIVPIGEIEVIQIDLQRTYNNEIEIYEMYGYKVKDRFVTNYEFYAYYNKIEKPSKLDIVYVMPDYTQPAWDDIHNIDYTINVLKKDVLVEEIKFDIDIDEERLRQQESFNQGAIGIGGLLTFWMNERFDINEVDDYSLEIIIDDHVTGATTIAYKLSSILKDTLEF